MSIRVGIRSGFSELDTYYDDICKYDFPVELTMPRADDMVNMMRDGMQKRLLGLIESGDLEVMSVHAPAARISNETFKDWAGDLFGLARAIGAQSVTFHPDHCKPNKKSRVQAAFVDMLRSVDGEDLYSMETFTGGHRLFTPQDIMDHGLPMTLDTSHIHDRSRLVEIVDTYHQNIRTVHLSSVTDKGQHQPIDQFCVDLMVRLADKGWSGDIVLEYLFEYHGGLRSDAWHLCQTLGVDL